MLSVSATNLPDEFKCINSQYSYVSKKFQNQNHLGWFVTFFITFLIIFFL